MKRQRGRNPRRNNNNNNNNNNTPNPNRSLDSNGPDVKIRGSANTIYEKYIGLARDAKTSGNRVKAENLLQHAEHYLRVHQVVQAKVDAIKAEKEAARLAREEQQRQNSANRESDDNGEKPKSEKSDRQEGRSRSRRNRDDHKAKSDGNAEQSTDTDSPAEASEQTQAPATGLEVVQPDSEAAPEKPRRRRAPARTKKAPESSETSKSDAAEAPAE